MTRWLRKIFFRPPSQQASVETRGALLQRPVSQKENELIERAVRRTVQEYGEALRRMGDD